MPTKTCFLCVCMASVFLSTSFSGAEPMKDAIAMKLQPFPMTDVRLLDGPFKTGQDINRAYLYSLDPERLLYNFRVTAGLPAPGEPLTGWEAPDCEVRGHFFGHYLSALAIMYASTDDEGLRDRGKYIVDELAKIQKANGNGYLSAFPESHWDKVEAAKPNWAQYYTIHKIMAGLLDQYEHCGNRKALKVLENLVAYFKNRLDKLSAHQMDKVLGATEEGGISEVVWNLYAVTGNPDHRALAEKFEKNAFLGPLALEHDNLSHIHGNTHIPLAIGAARHYELTGDERYATVARYFWERVVHTRSYATGGSTLNEVWPEPERLAKELGYKNQECCKTHNMLKLTRHIIRWTGDAAYADFYEQALFNSILGTQEPELGRVMYYIPLGTGFRKSVLSHSNHFYCCNGTGIESFSKFNDSIYFHDGDAIYVNLFIPSTVEWKDKGLHLTQDTRFPDESATTLTIHCKRPVDVAVKVRVPYWATQGVSVQVNGEPVEVDAAPGSYLSLDRTWNDGDTTAIAMPMALHAHPMPDDPDLMAFMYGPLVLAGITAPDDTGLPHIIPPGGGFPDGDREDNHDYFLGDPENLDAWFKPVPGESLTFHAKGQARDYTFIPFHRITGERYGVYWVVTQAGTPRHQRVLVEGLERETQAELERQREQSAVDRVRPGVADDEAAHNLQGEGMASGPHLDKHWRHATAWWSWDLKVLPDTPMTLLCTYWGSDVGRTFDILVDDVLLVSESLDNRDPGRFVDVEYAIPEALTKGKSRVTITFRGTNGSTAGGVFECYVFRPEAAGAAQ
jgi:uncharacterized protein